MAARGEVKYRITLDSSVFGKGVNEAEKAFDKFTKNLTANAGGIGSALAGLGPAGVGVAAAVGGITLAMGAFAKITADAVDKATTYADNLDALAQKTGLTTDALQALEVAAKLGNSSLDAVARGVNKMQKGLVAGSDAFKKLGLNIADLKKLDTQAQFVAVAKAIQGLGSSADQAAARMAVFGKSGNDLAGTLNAAAAGAGELGGALSGEAVAAAAALKDKTDLLGTAWDRVVLQFGAAVASSPELSQAISDLTAVVVEMAEKIKTAAPDIAAFFDKFVTGARLALGAIKPLGEFLGDLASVMGGGGSIGKALSNLKQNVEGLGFDEFMRKRNTENAALAFPKPKAGGSSGVSFGSGDKAAQQKAHDEMLKDLHTSFKMADDARDAEYKDVLAKWKAADAKQRAAKHEGAARDQDALENALGAQLEAWNNLFLGLEDMARQEEQERQERIQHWQDLTDTVAAANDLFQAFGMTAESAMGQVTQGLENGLNAATAYIAAQNDMQRAQALMAGAAGIVKQGSVLGGAMSGAAMGFAVAGPLGAGIGAVAGGLLGLFGKAKKAREELARLKKQGMETFESLKAKIADLKMDFLTKGVAGLGAMFKYAGEQADLTQEHFDRLGIVGIGMFEALKKEGLSTVEALKAMGPALDEAFKAAETAGLELGTAFGVLVEFRDRVLANEGLVNAIDGWAAAFDGLNATGNMTADMFAAMAGEVSNYVAGLVEAGFTHAQIMAMMGPDLFRLYEAQQKYGFAVDATTQALIDEALASGAFDDMKDPMEQLVELQGLMLEAIAALVKAFGSELPAAVQKYIDTLNAVPALPGAPGTPAGVTGGPPEEPGGGPPQLAGGGYIHKSGLAYLHAGETVTPMGDDDGVVGGIGEIGGHVDDAGVYHPPTGGHGGRGGGSASSGGGNVVGALQDILKSVKGQTPVNVQVAIPIDTTGLPRASQEQFKEDITRSVGRQMLPGGILYQQLSRTIKRVTAQAR